MLTRRLEVENSCVDVYEAQILSYIGGKTSAVYHAAKHALVRFDRIQERFIRNAGISEVEAICDYRLAPFCSRGDMAMLSIIYRSVFGIGPG